MKLVLRCICAFLLVLVVLAPIQVTQAASVHTVNSLADSGPGSLRQALQDALSGDTITFDPAVFPPGNPQTITLNSQLPYLTQGNLMVDASNAGVILDGSAIPAGISRGLVITSNGNTIRGLQIVRFPFDGIGIDGNNNLVGGDRGVGSGPMGQGNLISGNGGYGIQIWGGSAYANQVLGDYIGTTLSGMAAWPNNYAGVALQVSPGPHDNTIGGNTPGTRNLISGNNQAGIRLSEGAHHNIIAGNFIGVNASGSAALPNNEQGIMLWDGAAYNRIGGSTPGERNVLSGNLHEGVLIYQADTTNNTVIGNYIGVDASGQYSIGNAGGGIDIDSAAKNTIGGVNASPGGKCTGECNLISGNTGDNGISLFEATASQNQILGNYLGVNVDGMAAVPNSGGGIWIGRGGSQTVIGGSSAATRNLISGNHDRGIAIYDAGSNGTRILGNYIGTAASGTLDLGNQQDGIFIMGGADTQVGGPGAGDGNIITYNGYSGIHIDGDTTTGTLVQNNQVGIDADGTGQLDGRHLVVADDGSLFLANFGLGVFKSTDKAASWQAASSGLGSLNVTLLAVSPNFASSHTVWAFAEGKLYRSTSAGASWTLLAQNLPGTWFDLKVSPTYATDSLLLAARDDGVFRSPDGGQTWEQRVSGYYASSVSFSPAFASDHTTLAGVGPASVMRSTNSGVTWVDSGAGLPLANVYDFAFAGGPLKVFLITHACSNAGVYRSEDGGATWVASGTGIGDCGSYWKIAASPNFASDNTLLVGEDSAYLSINGGAGWNYASNHNYGSRTYALAFSPNFSVDHTVYRLSFAGVFRSQDGGQNWDWAGANLADHGNWMDGVRVEDNAHSVQILGNRVGSNGGCGIGIYSTQAGGTLISANRVGLSLDGETRAPEGTTGIKVENSGNITIDSNVSSAGSHGGFRSYNSAANHLTISNNKFGTNVSGEKAVANSYDGMSLYSSSDNLVQGNLVSGNAGDGIYVSTGSDRNILKGNRVGVNGGGTAALANQGTGINLYGVDNQVGGALPGEGNLLSGNSMFGIGVYANNNSLFGNLIGTNAAGTAAIPNVYGILILGAQNNQIGGSQAGQGNLISGNLSLGLLFSDSSNNVAKGNKIGTNLAGLASLPNQIGVTISDHSHNNQVGGVLPSPGVCSGDCNLISGNIGYGVFIGSQSTIVSENTVSGNFIGSNLTNTGIIPNWIGILLAGPTNNNHIGDPAAPLGAACSAGCNVIRGNISDGVQATGAEVIHNSITRNRIYQNGEMGINLKNGANNSLAAPLITSASVLQASGTTCASCTVEIYSDVAGQGRVLEGVVTAGNNGTWSYTPAIHFIGPNLTALAIDLTGNTSAFSQRFSLFSYSVYLPTINK